MRSWASSSPDPTHRFRIAVSAGLVLALSVGACAAGAGGTASTVSGAWVRPPQGVDRPAAGYLVITGGTVADALIGASSPVAGSVQIHETSTDASGMTGMHPVARVEIPAGATVTFQPGGYHLMFMQLSGTIEVGKTVQIDLTFEKAGKVTVQAEVRQG